MKWPWSKDNALSQESTDLTVPGTQQPLGSAAALAQKILGEATETTNSTQRRFARAANFRKVPAYLIKGIAIFGGLLITVIPQAYVPYAGLTISAMVLIDQWLSNHRRMIVYSVADKALQRTLRRVKSEYNHHIVQVVRLASLPEKEHEANDMLIDLARLSSKVLSDEMDRIQAAVDQADIEFLSALNVDKSTQTHISPPSTPPQPPAAI